MPAVAPQPLASTSGTSGPSATGMRFHDPRRSPSKRSGVVWSRGNSLSGSRAQVEASARARSSSSANRSSARSRRRRGSTSTTLAVDVDVPDEPDVASSRSVRSVGRSTSQGNQLSMPSNRDPSASRSQCSRPHGSEATKRLARSRRSSSRTSSRAGKTMASARSRSLR